MMDTYASTHHLVSINPAIDPNFSGNLIIDKHDDQPIVRISLYAFYRCNITNITLPDSIIFIGDYSFSSSKIESITLGSQLFQIGNAAYSGSQIKFANFSIAKLTRSLGKSIFYGTMIEEVLFPDSMEVFAFTSILYRFFGEFGFICDIDFEYKLNRYDRTLTMAISTSLIYFYASSFKS
ncbi:cell surface protein, putative [Trichomonas vaginalis G3]|uniref:Cell surface protein, putative n=1 Tax=Trichomonas vaginalis (strain ATCC PRA-98 / G3) TaxID=412133 RepID=A2DXD9_TRIV3|nr:BspA type Leucine rich repeat region (6 copies) family [Trichomonas vaginalis G3]EAY14891.1 cell surface protein, putative [Trichomonas vaginalis G3]KAI5485450.1 BspA type Leucine rich repeat region (6 copies) family [Trichomonas vaginalis G3]|eukprot:XP_001327114.1 cell surface protein [Trichomonas vaginalis G3]